MKRFRWPLPLLAALAFATGAMADDTPGLLEQAQQALLHVPAVRMTVDSVDHTKNRTVHTVVEIVNPNQLHSTTTIDGKLTNEVISDGHKTVMRHDDGPFQPMLDNAAEMVMNARKSVAGEGLALMAANVKLLGHEDVNGTPATVYTFNTNTLGLTSTSKVWLADKDHLPLKAERHTQGETKLAGGSPGVKVDRDGTVIYEYDPAIKITLPAS